MHPEIAGAALKLIGRLFRIEGEAKDLSHADRLAMRGLQSQPVIDELLEKLLAWRDRLVPKHPVAIGYCLNQWSPLTAFLKDGAIALDNNVAEREMKRIALGRKNFLFVGNARGGETAAILASLTSSCRRHGIDPQLDLTQLLTNLPSAKPSELADWLPDQWKANQPPPPATE